MSHLEAFLASCGLIWLGVRWLKDVKQARNSGVGHFFFQWPNDFDRSRQPVAFGWCIMLYSLGGYMAFVFAAILAAHIFI
jgi:hypothetical protein